LTAAAAMALSDARADTYCSGSSLEHLVLNEGTLAIRSSWRNDWTYLCNMQAPWKGVAVESCYSWFAMVASAKVHNKQIGVYYVGDVTCATIGTYGNAPAPHYVRMAE
jgi:hypothetical protein